MQRFIACVRDAAVTARHVREVAIKWAEVGREGGERDKTECKETRRGGGGGGGEGGFVLSLDRDKGMM